MEVDRTRVSCALGWLCDAKRYKTLCDTTQFSLLPFFYPRAQPHGVWVLKKHYHIQLYPKLGHVTCIILQIVYGCYVCTSIIDKHWDPGIAPPNQSRYQPVKYFTYWSVLGVFDN